MKLRQIHSAGLFIFLLVSAACSTLPKVTPTLAPVPPTQQPLSQQPLAPSPKIAPAIVIAPEYRGKYHRSDWRHWVDTDGDCQDARQEALIRDAQQVVLNAKGCRVRSGIWHDPYTGKTLTLPRQIDVDHMVPLKEAWESGAWHWSRIKRQNYANNLDDPHHLISVSAGANRSKGARSPDEWMPSEKKWQCTYIADWVRIKRNWQLSMDMPEFRFVQKRYTACGFGKLLATSTLPDSLQSSPPAHKAAPSFSPKSPAVAAPASAPKKSSACCRRCNPGRSKPCGNSCIGLNKTCHKEAGCACSQ